MVLMGLKILTILNNNSRISKISKINLSFLMVAFLNSRIILKILSSRQIRALIITKIIISIMDSLIIKVPDNPNMTRCRSNKIKTSIAHKIINNKR